MSKEKLNLTIPENLNEEELIEVIKDAARPHLKKYCFLGHTEEDMLQLAIMYGIDGSHRWDGKRPIKNFLSVHIKNRLYNYKRKHSIKMETPCKKCPLNAYIKPNKCKIYQDRMDCELFRNWKNRNQEKQNINNALGFDVVDDIGERSMMLDDTLGEDIDRAEILDKIDKSIHLEFRKDYLIFIRGGKLSNSRRVKLMEHIESILWPKREQPEL